MQSNRDSVPGEPPQLCTDAPPMDETALLNHVTAGDPAARRRFFDAYAPRIWRLLYRITGEYDDAHDLTQETFLRAFRKLDSFDRRGSLHGWLARIALNLTRDEMRRRTRRADRLREVHIVAPAAPASDPLLRARVRTAVDELGVEERTVLVMHDLEGYTHEEIGTALGIATGSSRARLSRARARLRNSLRSIRGEESS